MQTGTIGAALAMALLLPACGAEETGPSGSEHDGQVVAILEAADARPVAADSLAPILEGLRAPEPLLRIHAVRALGRLERPGLIAEIRPLLDDPEPVVRAEAANAIAQATQRTDTTDARAILRAALESETEPDVVGVIAQSLGRLRAADAPTVESTGRVLATRLEAAGPLGRIGIARGFFHLARQPAARDAVPAEAADALRALYRGASDTTQLDRRVRALAAASLVNARAASMEDYVTILADDDPYVRREAVAGLPFAPDAESARTLVDVTLRDTSPVVRYEALRAYGRQDRIPADCAPVERAVGDEDAHVALFAIDLLAGCGSGAARVARLDTLANTLPAGPDGAWHRAAHALVTLAALDRGQATTQLPDFVAHADPFVRSYAARAAAALQDGNALRTLVDDTVSNVRLAALQGLATVAPDDATAAALRILETADGELAMVAAATLEGTRDPSAPEMLLAALDRLTALQRETSRDPRVAILERLAEVGTPADSARLRPLLRDFDPVIAQRVADLLSRWTGSAVEAAPEPLPPQPFPTVDELRALARDTVEVALENGSTFLVRLHPWDAPTNAARFARLARDGYFDGLTMHRVVPNFVVQGGSPAANEYVGDGPFSRDEVGIDGNWRGTVGLSTRGRDTGDAQLYVNLVDNIRLDHDYTVFGEVVSGMAAVREVLEGTRIQSMRVRGR